MERRLGMRSSLSEPKAFKDAPAKFIERLARRSTRLIRNYECPKGRAVSGRSAGRACEALSDF